MFGDGPRGRSLRLPGADPGARPGRGRAGRRRATPCEGRPIAGRAAPGPPHGATRRATRSIRDAAQAATAGAEARADLPMVESRRASGGRRGTSSSGPTGGGRRSSRASSRTRSRGSQRTSLCHELHSLSEAVLVVDRDSPNRWEPKAPGIELKPVAGRTDAGGIGRPEGGPDPRAGPRILGPEPQRRRPGLGASPPAQAALSLREHRRRRHRRRHLRPRLIGRDRPRDHPAARSPEDARGARGGSTGRPGSPT